MLSQAQLKELEDYYTLWYLSQEVAEMIRAMGPTRTVVRSIPPLEPGILHTIFQVK